MDTIDSSVSATYDFGSVLIGVHDTDGIKDYPLSIREAKQLHALLGQAIKDAEEARSGATQDKAT